MIVKIVSPSLDRVCPVVVITVKHHLKSTGSDHPTHLLSAVFHHASPVLARCTGRDL